MSKADSLKEEVSWLKVLCGASFAGLASLLGWLVQNYETANRIIAAGALIGAPVFVALIVLLIVRINRRIRELEAL